MFIAGVLAGPAVAILAGEFLFKPAGVTPRWALLAIAALMLAIAFVPFFTPDLKGGLLIGFLVGLLLFGTPMALLPVERSEESAPQS